jgi:hypothetical protein
MNGVRGVRYFGVNDRVKVDVWDNWRVRKE